MTAIVVLFNLREGVDPGQYEAWAKTTDLPVVNRLASVDRFQVLRAEGLFGSSSPAPYDYVEIIDVNDMDQFGNEVASETIQRVAGEFQELRIAPFSLQPRLWRPRASGT